MCIVFIHHDPENEFPIKIGANREESAMRPATMPAICNHCLLAGKDKGPQGQYQTVGTWWGINTQHSLFVAVTNRDDTAGRNKFNSRGVLCATATMFDLKIALKTIVSELKTGGYGGCNFLLADKKEIYCIHGKNSYKPEVIKLGLGLHVLTNLNVNDPKDNRINYIKTHLRTDNENFEKSAKSLLVHPNIIVEDEDWGTVASSVLMFSGENYKLWHHLGKPYYAEDLKLWEQK